MSKFLAIAFGTLFYWKPSAGVVIAVLNAAAVQVGAVASAIEAADIRVLCCGKRSLLFPKTAFCLLHFHSAICCMNTKKSYSRVFIGFFLHKKL